MSMSQPDAESILEKVVEITAKVLDVDKKKLSPESKFAEDLGADSLSRVDLILALEHEFQVEIDEQEANEIRSIDDAVQHLVVLLDHTASSDSASAIDSKQLSFH